MIRFLLKHQLATPVEIRATMLRTIYKDCNEDIAYLTVWDVDEGREREIRLLTMSVF